VSANNPARSLALLWGSHSRAGRSGLSIKAIVTAATELADSSGLDALSMRKVAERLGVGTMSLYTHVPGKTELTELMVDAALGELYKDLDEPAKQGDWRAGMEFVVKRNWAVYVKHTWLMQAASARPNLGPNAVRKYEAELRPLDGIGLSDVEMDSALALVLGHVESQARQQNSLAQARQDQSDFEWWQEQAPILEKLMAGTNLPVAGRVGEASSMYYQAAAWPEHVLAFGLARILDGIEQLIK
jgi:AcrR family transcriptional regulator